MIEKQESLMLSIRVCYNDDGSTYANWQSAYEITNVE